MKEVIEIIEQLSELSGNAQLDYLESHKDNKTLREVLYYTYNPNFKYNINEAKLDKALKKVITTCDIKESDYTIIDKDVWEQYKNLLDSLASKTGVKEADIISLCQRFLTHREQKSKLLLRNILLKDLKINMGIKSFNKVWSDFCFKYPYLGARPFNMKNLSKIKYPSLAQTKLDGMFCNFIVKKDSNTVEYISRQGKPITVKGSLDDELLNINIKQDFVLNGELLVWNKETNRPLPREVANGIIRRDNKTAEELDAIRSVVWDIVPYENFIQGEWNIDYQTRYNILHNYVKGEKITPVDTTVINSVDEALELFEKKYSQGEEGIVVKERDLQWFDGKPKGCVKVKSEKECDLKAVGFEEGSGAYAGMCGSIECISGDGLLKVGIKPRTPEQAITIWNNQDSYRDKILTVRYNEKIQRKDTNTWSLFLPRYVEWRDLDKTTADNLSEIE